MKFIHVSDLHFHWHKKDNRKATKTLGFIKKEYPNHHLIVTGDIVDDGHEEQYGRAFDALKDFMGRIYISPGNHDFGAAVLVSLKENRTCSIGNVLQKRYDNGRRLS